MKTLFPILAIASAFGTAPLSAQRQPPTVSPEVRENGKVTFRLKAPNAEEVKVKGQWGNATAAMEKDAEGIWSATVGEVGPGVWEYEFQVDGLTMIDPANPWIKPMQSPHTSILHIAADPPALYDFRDVPHGTVRKHAYFSKPLDRLRYLTVYTPPGYDGKTGESYPVLYLQHGSGDNQDTWTVHGKAHWIADNLLAEGKAVPMIIVMMDGHAQVPRGRDNTGSFVRDLLEEVMPFIETNYRVKADAAHRAITGLSMGGGQALTIGLNHTDTFAWIGAFSAGGPGGDALAAALENREATNKNLKLLWIACGKDDFLIKPNQDLVALLKSREINHQWHLTEGNHSWPVWRGYLGDLLPLLFR